MRLSLCLRPRISLSVVALMIASASIAQAQNFQVIHSFTGGLDGSNPQAGLTVDKAGSLYTTTTAGGYHAGDCTTSGCGVVVKFSRQGSSWGRRSCRPQSPRTGG